MRMSVLKDDSMVIVNGETLEINVSDLPSYIHVLRWDGHIGEIEFATDQSGKKMPNLTFNDYKFIQPYFERFESIKRQRQEKADEEARMEKQAEEARKAQLKELQNRKLDNGQHT